MLTYLQISESFLSNLLDDLSYVPRDGIIQILQLSLDQTQNNKLSADNANMMS